MAYFSRDCNMMMMMMMTCCLYFRVGRCMRNRWAMSWASSKTLFTSKYERIIHIYFLSVSSSVREGCSVLIIVAIRECQLSKNRRAREGGMGGGRREGEKEGSWLSEAKRGDLK